MREHFPPVTINFAHVRIIGIPGLSLVAIAVAIAFEFPIGRALLFSGLAGGLLAAAALILARRPREQASTEPPRGPLMTSERFSGLAGSRQAGDGRSARVTVASAPA